MSPPCRLEADVSDKFIQVGLKLFMAQGTPPDKKICMMHLKCKACKKYQFRTVENNK